MKKTTVPYLHIASRLFNTPLLIHPAKLRVIQDVLAQRMHFNLQDDEEPDEIFVSNERERLPFQVINGVGVIDIFGTLVQRSSFMDAASGLTGYDAIKRDFIIAAESSEVRSILMRVDSPGGEVGGLFDLGDFIREVSASKPVTAFVEGDALSAAYLITSAASKVTSSQTARLGSIGVVATLFDISEANEKEGVKVNHIFAGKRKVDGSPFIPLSDDARSVFQAEVDTIYDIFVGRVAVHRGISQEAVRGTEAGVFNTEDAIRIGLLDSVDTIESALATAIDAANISSRTIITAMKGRDSMTMDIQVPGAETSAESEAAQVSEQPEEGGADVPITLSSIFEKATIILKGAASAVYAAGKGFAALSIDGGGSWVDIVSPCAEGIKNIVASDKPDCFGFVSEGGDEFITSDAGASWQKRASEAETKAADYQERLQSHRDICAAHGFSTELAVRLADGNVTIEAATAIMLEAKAEHDEETAVLSSTGQDAKVDGAGAALTAAVEAGNKRDEENRAFTIM